MPQNTVLCRICLAMDKSVYTIADTPLQAVYEKIANTSLNTADLRPVAICFICCAELKKCLKLMLISVKAENILERILVRHPNAAKSTKKLLTLVKRKTNGLCGSLSVTPVDCIDTLTFNTPIVIKNEPADQEEIINIKTERDHDDCAGSPPLPHFTSGVETDRILNLRDAVVLQNIRLEQECYGYKLKMESAEENWQEGVPAKNSTPEKPNKIKDKSTERYFECNECQRRFGRKCHLETHMIIHSGSREKLSLTCNICHRQLGSKTGLYRHMKIHSGEKPHACNFCPSRFIEKASLTKHIRTHTGEKPYACEECARGFKQLGDLRRHARTHSGEKPFKCHVCQRRFNERSKVTRHSKRHFGEKLSKRDYLKLLK